MKLFHSLMVAAALLFTTVGLASAQDYGGGVYRKHNELNIGTGGSFNVLSGGAVGITGPTFSTAITGNPLMQATYQNITTASANATTPIIAATAGKTIHVVGGGLTIMASGTASGATDVSLKCSGGTIIARFPIATLVDQVPVGPFASAGIITTGPGLTKPCGAGESVLVSATGTLATTTNLFVNVPYTIQ